MARPQKEGLNYFPHDMNCDDKVKLVESQFDVEGIYVLIKKRWQIICDKVYLVDWTEKSIVAV
jgi:hypothetical protein